MKQQLRDVAESMGCAGFGVTDSAEFAGLASVMHERNGSGYSGRVRFTYKDPDLAADVTKSLPWARSLVVVSWSYLPAAGSPGPGRPGTGRIARFATEDHYAGLRSALGAIAAELREAGYRAESLVDDDRLVDRAAAVRAGVVWWGKSTMALDPRHGPWLLLGTVATDAALPVDAPMSRDCGTCDACIPACPTSAIVAPGVLDASRCLAHWLQTAGVFPREFRQQLGDRFYGCDDCLDACPPGHKQLPGSAGAVCRVDLVEILLAEDEVLRDRFSHFFIPRRNPRVLRRNAIIALANSIAMSGGTDADGVPVIADFLSGDDELLRLHAAWALGRVGGSAAARALLGRRDSERVPRVKQEIESAIAGLRLEPPQAQQPERM